MRALAIVVVLAACGGAKKKSVDTTTGIGPGDSTPGGGGPDTGANACRDLEGDPLGSCLPAEGDGNAGEPQIEVVGAIPKDSIHRVVRENFAAIRYCYENLVMANPTLAGRVVARFKVGLDGTVSDATATGVHPDLETCVADKIRKFRFPKPDGGGAVEVTYPLMFKPG